MRYESISKLYITIANESEGHYYKYYLWSIQNERQNMYKKICPQKSISGVTLLFGNLATGHFSTKFCPFVPLSGHTGSNDTGLTSV